MRGGPLRPSSRRQTASSVINTTAWSKARNLCCAVGGMGPFDAGDGKNYSYSSSRNTKTCVTYKPQVGGAPFHHYLPLPLQEKPLKCQWWLMRKTSNNFKVQQSGETGISLSSRQAFARLCRFSPGGPGIGAEGENGGAGSEGMSAGWAVQSVDERPRGKDGGID